MHKLKWIKYGLLLLILLLIPFSTNDYIQYRPPILPKTTNKSVVENTAKVEDKAALSEIKSFKKKKKQESTPEKKEVPELLVASPLTLETSISINLLNEDSINSELQAFVACIHPEQLKLVKKFYIPPAEYDIDFKKLILPSALISVGAIASQTEHYRDLIPIPRPNGAVTQHRYDDALQYVVPSSLFVFDIIGKEKHNPIDQFFVMGIAYGMTALEVRNLKKVLREERPDGGMYSFPSGHTAVAFVGAHMIYKEFKDTNPWIAYSGYTMAAAVGAGRMINNRHWMSDVVAGAGFAILSTELAYMIYFPVRNVITNGANKVFGKYMIVTPVMYPDALGLQVHYSF